MKQFWSQLASSSRSRTWLAVAALLLLPLLCFLPAALHRGVFFVHDIQYFFFPFHAATAALSQQGELPLWNPYAFSGMPLLGDAQSALLYPPNWLFLVLPADIAFSWVVLLQFFIAGIGMYFFLRTLRLSALPAFVGAVVFMLCGFMTARVVHLSILSGTALIPLVFLCVHRALQAPATVAAAEMSPLPANTSNTSSIAWLGAASGALALQVFTGHPQVPLYTACAVSLYTGAMALERRRATVLLRGLAILLLGYALAAVQLLPLKELLDHSHRAGPGVSFEFIFQNSTSPGDWFLLLFPYAFGALKQGRYSEEAIDAKVGSPLWEHSIYIGVLPLALAALAIWWLAGRLRRRRSSTAGRPPQGPSLDSAASLEQPLLSLHLWGFFTVLVFLCALVASGRFTPLAHLIYRLPVLGQLRDPERAMVLADFALAALAALGFELLRQVPAALERSHALRRRLMVVASGILALPLLSLALLRLPSVAARVRPQILENLQLGRWNTLVPLTLAAVSAGILFYAARRKAGPWVQALAVGLVVIDLGSYAAAFNPTTDPQLYRRPPEVLTAFRQKQQTTDTTPFRKASFLKFNNLDTEVAKETLAVSWAMVYGIEDINGFSSMQPRRYTDYLFDPQEEELSMGTLDNRRLLRADSPILSSLNVKYLLVPTILRPRLGKHLQLVHENEHVRVYENSGVYPRAYFTESVQLAPPSPALLEAVQAEGFDGRKLAYVEPSSSLLPALLAGPASGAAQVTMENRSANRMQLATRTEQPRLLVLSEMYFPGWRAFIDGAETPIHRTNYLFRGIAVPAGDHVVTLVYRPRSAMRGLAISAAAALVVLIPLAGSALSARRRRRHPAPA